ncbi:MAG: response regulator, partial [Verrucomicrobiota bacterium]
MNTILATSLGFLAQEDAGSSSRTSIIIGILAFPCLVIISVIWHKLKAAKESDKHIEKLQKQVSELKKATSTTQTRTVSPVSPSTARPIKIIHVDDEKWLLKMVGHAIKANQEYKKISVQTFQNRDEAWQELLHTDPDLLITDLRNDNVPGRAQEFGMSGFELLTLLASKGVKYPIVVFSGSLSIEGIEHSARQAAGNELNISFLKKPATSEQLFSELSKHLGRDNAYVHNLDAQQVWRKAESQSY